MQLLLSIPVFGVCQIPSTSLIPGFRFPGWVSLALCGHYIVQVDKIRGILRPGQNYPSTQTRKSRPPCKGEQPPDLGGRGGDVLDVTVSRITIRDVRAAGAMMRGCNQQLSE